MIRLAQMLGGVPAPAMHFESRIIKEKDKEERMIYVPVVREEDQKASEELKQKYQFHGKLPDEIILVCPRNRRDIREDQVDQVWKTVSGQQRLISGKETDIRPDAALRYLTLPGKGMCGKRKNCLISGQR